MAPPIRVLEVESANAPPRGLDKLKADKLAADAAYTKALEEQSAGLKEEFLTLLVLLWKKGKAIQEMGTLWRFPGLIMPELMVWNAVAALGKASPEEVNNQIGASLETFLGSKDSLEYISHTLEERSQTQLKDKKGSPVNAIPIFRRHEDSSYSVVDPAGAPQHSKD